MPNAKNLVFFDEYEHTGKSGGYAARGEERVRRSWAEVKRKNDT